MGGEDDWEIGITVHTVGGQRYTGESLCGARCTNGAAMSRGAVSGAVSDDEAAGRVKEVRDCSIGATLGGPRCSRVAVPRGLSHRARHEGGGERR